MKFSSLWSLSDFIRSDQAEEGSRGNLRASWQSLNSLRQWQCFSGLSSDQFAPSWISWWFDLFGFICCISWLLLFSCITSLYYSVLFYICILYYSLTLYFYLLLSYLAFFSNFKLLNCQSFHPFYVLRCFVCWVFGVCLLPPPPSPRNWLLKFSLLLEHLFQFHNLLFSPSNTMVLFCLYFRILEIKTLAETKFIWFAK